MDYTNVFEISSNLIYFYPLNDGMPTCGFEFYKNGELVLDNDKSDDLHLILFEGTLNWQKVINKLKECNYDGPITLELCYRNQYLNMSLEEFYKKGYDIACKLNEMSKNN